MTEYSIGVDLGGTNLRAAVVDQDGNLLDQVNVATSPDKGRDYVIGEIVDSIQKLRAKQSEGRFAGVGIGVPGFILIDKGIIVGSNNLAFLEGFALRDDIERRLGAPVILENDANSAALGESWIGAGQDVDDLVLLTLGTGIGGGIIYGNRVMHGREGMAGELGHITVVPNGNPCGCGNVGCLEKHASATAISCLADLMRVTPHPNPSAEEIFKLAAAGDWKAQQIFRSMGEALGVALAMLINTFNFPLFLLSGGPLPAWDYFAPAMIDEVKRRSFTYRNTKTRIEKAKLGNQAGLFGAAYLPFQAQNYRA
ncbi:ROK family protein [Bryobacter aggregatus]|uniref:ROK family protein n=1 Tax=Bryobacter aggregatus TaxID=360054 RepID=UPI0004E11ABC|nr:ROK family protein [Bryobacter aggregatus]